MTDWVGKKVLMIGAARQGLALSRYLAGKGSSVILNDRRPEEELSVVKQDIQGLEITLVAGSHPVGLLDDIQLVCISGGVPLDLPLIQEAIRRNIPITNDSQIFLEAAPCKVIGITGSAGKTTTTALVGEIARQHYALKKPEHHVWVGGNIGNPLILDLDKMGTEDIAIMELSSFQLEIMSRSPQIAAILNLTPNHLDRHKTMAKYITAKARILTNQSNNDVAVLNRDDPNVRELFAEVNGRRITFGINPPHNKQDATYYKRGKLYLQASGQVAKIIKSDLINIRGTHNLYNVLAAIAISAAATFSLPAMYDGIVNFKGVSHRLEFVRSWRGADWYNDSIATTPERAIAGIDSFDQPIILLAGGRDKDLPWERLGQVIQQRVDHLVLFGEAADLIMETVTGQGKETQRFTVDHCKSLEQAVQKAAEHVQPGDVVLLSPGGTSFDEFTDFEERGRRFTQWVKELS